MRRVLGVLLFAAMLALPAGAPARAADTSEYVNELKRIQQAMRELAVEAKNMQFQPKYCLPPNEPLKQPDIDRMADVRARADDLNRQFLETKTSLIDFLKHNPELRQTLMLDNRDPVEDSYWRNSTYQGARDFMFRNVQAKEKELAGKRERDCNPPPPKKVEQVVPTQPINMDPGVTLPGVTVRDVGIPEIPDRLCSEAEKQALLQKFWDANWPIYMNFQDAREYVDAIGKALREKRGNADALRAMLPGAEARLRERKEISIAFEKAYERAKAMPISNCGGTGGGEDRRVGVIGDFSTDAFVGDLKLPDFRYVGFEHPISSEQTFGIEQLNDDDTVTGGGADISLKISAGYKSDSSFGIGDYKGYADSLRFGFALSRVALSGAAEELDPLGERLLLPGTGDAGANYPLGLSLNSNVGLGVPGGANMVEDIGYRYRGEMNGMWGKYARTWTYDRSALTGYGGLAFAQLNQEQSYAGYISGYSSGFRYNSDVDVDAIRIVGGLNYSHRVTPCISLYGSGMGFVNFASADGIDGFRIDGGVDDVQRVRVSKDDTTFSYGIAAGVDFEFMPGAKIGIGAGYKSEDIVPVIIRDGNNPSHIEFDRSDATYGVLRTRFQF